MMRVAILEAIYLLCKGLSNTQAKLVNRALVREEKVEEPVVELAFFGSFHLGHHSTVVLLVTVVLLFELEQVRVHADKKDREL